MVLPLIRAAVGLTAAFATAAGTAGVSCNVLAGVHHDHILAPVVRAKDATRVLLELARAHQH